MIKYNMLDQKQTNHQLLKQILRDLTILSGDIREMKRDLNYLKIKQFSKVEEPVKTIKEPEPATSSGWFFA
mgnify:FL=1